MLAFMNFLNFQVVLPLAQALQNAASTPTSNSVNPPPWANPQFFIWPLLIVFLLWTLFRSNKTRGKQQKLVMETLKKGDRVQTIGGILGTVVELRENDVVVKVDETSNTKIRFTRTAIHRVLDEDGKDIEKRK